MRQETELMLRATIEGVSEMVAVEDPQARYIAFNRAYQAEFKKIFGIELQIGDNMVEALAGLPMEQQAVAELFRRTMSGEDFVTTHAFGAENYARRVYEIHCFPIYDADGTLLGGTHVARDVTEIKLLKEALSVNEENSRRIIESSPLCIKAIDLQGRLLSLNKGGQNLLELEQLNEYVGGLWIETWEDEHRAAAAAALGEAMSGKIGRFRGASKTPRGKLKWWDETIVPVTDVSGRLERVMVIAQDITEQKRIEDELRAAMERAEEGRRLLEALMEHVPEGIAIADAPDLRIRMVSREGQEIYPPREGMTARDIAAESRLFRPDGVTRLTFEELPLVRAIRQNEIIKDAEMIYIGEGGERKNLLTNASPIHDSVGRVIGGIVAWHEVTHRKQAEETLKNERGFLRQVIDAAPSMIFVKDWDGRFVLANEALANCYGTTVQDVVGRTDADFNKNPDEVKHFLQDDREVMLSCEQKLIPEEKVTFANGEVHWFSTIKVPLFDGEGNCNTLLGVASDITARKHAESALRRFRIALDSAADNIFIIDPQTMKFQDVSQSACRDLGFSREELLGMGPPDIMPHVSIDDLRKQFAEIRSDPAGKGAIETVHYRKDCTGFEVEVMLRPIEDEGRPLLVAVARDITERKLTEVRMRQANEQLAEADQRKDEFLAMLAHELRNPLAPIRNAVQVLRLAMRQEPLLQRQRDIIDRQVSHMARLLDDLLDVSRITRGKITLKQEIINLSDVFARAIESASPLIESRRHTLTISPPPDDIRVMGDFDRLIQIVGNLLNNSAKYTEEGGSIWLEAQREDGEVSISVRDTGMGIAPEMLPKIFDVFTQATRSLDRAQGGLGLGLALVRNLTEMHGGRIEAKSAGLGKGSEFIVHLPVLAGAETRETREEYIPTEARTHRRILVVDDVADTANSLAELLGMIGHEVQTAFEGTSVLRIAREFRPHVILLDIGLPGENGYEVARQIRRDPMLKDTVLVALTGYGQDEDRKMAEEAGFDHLFTKPVELGALEPYLS